LKCDEGLRRYNATVRHDGEGQGHFGTTIYGDHETASAINDLVISDLSEAIYDGKLAKIPEDDWMAIPLRHDWDKSGAKLAHKV